MEILQHCWDNVPFGNLNKLIENQKRIFWWKSHPVACITNIMCFYCFLFDFYVQLMSIDVSMHLGGMWKVQNETTTVRLFLSKMILHSGYEDTFFSKNSDSCRNIKKFFSLWNPPWSWRLKFSFHNDPFKLADLFHLLNHFIILWIRRSWDFLNFCRLIVIFENSISEERIVSKEETSIFKFVEDFITFYQLFLTQV